MPRYDYECDTCHHRFELKQSFDSKAVTTCPKCENTAFRRFHSVPVVFKGSGWYVNDYGRRGSLSSSASESKEPSDSDSKSEAKSESKSDSTTKADSKSKPSKAKAKGD